jgi:hypothetical protein
VVPEPIDTCLTNQRTLDKMAEGQEPCLATLVDLQSKFTVTGCGNCELRLEKEGIGSYAESFTLYISENHPAPELLIRRRSWKQKIPLSHGLVHITVCRSGVNRMAHILGAVAFADHPNLARGMTLVTPTELDVWIHRNLRDMVGRSRDFFYEQSCCFSYHPTLNAFPTPVLSFHHVNMITQKGSVPTLKDWAFLSALKLLAKGEPKLENIDLRKVVPGYTQALFCNMLKVKIYKLHLVGQPRHHDTYSSASDSDD